MPLSEQYGDDAVGGVHLEQHGAGGYRTMLGGVTSNHAALIQIIVGLLGLWLISKVMKGA